MFKRFAPLVCAALLAALLFSLPAAATPAEPHPYYPTGGVAEYTLTEVPATDNAPLTLQDDRTLEEIIVEGLRNVEESISIPAGMLPFTSREETADIYFAIVRTHPEFFYVENGAGFSILNGYVVSFSPYYNEKLATEEVISALNDRVNKILDETTAPGMSQVEKALSLHDYLVLHCAYDWGTSNVQEKGENGAPLYTPPSQVYTAYGSLMEGNAVCQGYAMGYNLLLNKAGINARYVTSSSINHGWSLVELNGKWYHVDVTWDDPMWGSTGSSYDMPGYCSHTYFLLSSEAMADHGTFSVPEATDKTYESGFLFSGARTPFFQADGGFYYYAGSGQMAYTSDLSSAGSAGSAIAQRHGQTVFYRANNYAGFYGYDLISRQCYALNDIDSGSDWGLAEYSDGVYLVEPNKTSPGVTQGQQLTLPRDGALHFSQTASSLTSATVLVRSGMSTPQTLSLCLAGYDQAGRMVTLDWTAVEVGPGETVEVSLSSPEADATTANLLYLDSTGTPLRESVSLQP